MNTRRALREFGAEAMHELISQWRNLTVLCWREPAEHRLSRVHDKATHAATTRHRVNEVRELGVRRLVVDFGGFIAISGDTNAALHRYRQAAPSASAVCVGHTHHAHTVSAGAC